MNTLSNPSMSERLTAAPPFDPTAGLPDYLYVKLADYLAHRITDGSLPSGARLSGERNMAAEYGVSVSTARRVVQLLRERGLVTISPSRGTFVTVQRADQVGAEKGDGQHA